MTKDTNKATLIKIQKDLQALVEQLKKLAAQYRNFG